MKLWVAFFVAAVCALHLPDRGDAGHHHPKSRSIAKRGQASQGEVFFSSTLITLMRKNPNTDNSEIKKAFRDIARSLSEEELESDHLEAIIIGKYGDGSYTEDDKEYFAALLAHLENHSMESSERKMETKYPGNRGKLHNAAMKIFPALTVQELKSSNVLQIIEDKFAAFMNQEATVEPEN